ncbi:MAG: hypothetical protein HOO93_04815 [Methyloglobulus sp.]|nr:hypothetical protein [Methyloglobulus sp.]
MNYLLAIFCCAISISSFAADTYIPPVQRPPAEIDALTLKINAQQVAIRQHHQNRLTLAKQRKAKAGQPNAGFPLPSFGGIPVKIQ